MRVYLIKVLSEVLIRRYELILNLQVSDNVLINGRYPAVGIPGSLEQLLPLLG